MQDLVVDCLMVTSQEGILEDIKDPISPQDPQLPIAEFPRLSAVIAYRAIVM
jgi:hypothetical protein